MKTLKDYLEETIRRYGAVGSSPGMGYTLESDQLDEILGPDQLSKLQSIKSQLPKAGGQKPSVPTDADRAEADAWLAGLKGGTPAAAPAASGEAPINFDRPGRPRSVSHGELQNKIAKLKNIKGLLKSISKMEPRATRAANKVGGSEEIATKSQMMQDMINNLNISYTSGQELDSIERRMGEYLQQLTAKGAAWTRPTRANKSGAVTIIKPGEIAEDDFEEGWKQKVAGAALAGAAALGAGGAQAQSTDRFDPAWGTSGYNTSIRSNVSSTKSMNAADPSKDVDDFQKRIQTVTGPNAKGEYKVVVIQGNDIVSHYVTKTPPPGWMAKNNEVDEGWKQKVAGAALAGAAALGAGGAQAQSTDKYDPDWNAHSMTHHIRSDVSSTKGMNSADPSQNIDDFQKRIQKVTGPNAKGEYKVIVLQNGDIVSHYVTKTPPPDWLYKEDAASNDPLLAKAVDLAPVSALEENAELRLILQRAKLIE